MRFSLLSLLGAVLVVAIGLFALLNANLIWAGVARAALILFLTFAILGGVNSLGRKRAFWFGVAIVGWIYLATTVLNHRWFGGNVLGQQFSQILWSLVGNEAFDPQQVRIGADVLDDGRVVPREFEYVPLEASFHIVAESILNALWALVGGYIALWFYCRRDARPNQPVTNH
jgi:hypothetical protein